MAPKLANNPFRRTQVLAAVLIAVSGTVGNDRVAGQQLRVAELGECPLESGEVIRDCRVGYRMVGELAADHRNVVLFLTWGNGTSEQLLGYIGPTGFVDPAENLVIAIDAFGNGVSSSPSNSPEQPGVTFPRFTFRDMVRAQHRLVSDVLEFEAVQAVMGISQGAFQALEWATTYPEFMDKVVSVVGTPRPSPHDLMVYSLFDSILTGCEPDRCDAAKEAYVAALRLLLQTPQARARTLDRDGVREYLQTIPQAAQDFPAASDIRSQTHASLMMDVSEPFGGSLEEAAQVVQAEMLIVVATHDLITTPEASREFARLTDAELYQTGGDCGHQVFVCEADEIGSLIRSFLR